MLKEKKTPATTSIKCKKKPFGNDLKRITEISWRIMNLYWQVKVFEPLDIDVWAEKYALILLGNSLGFADPSAVTTNTLLSPLSSFYLSWFENTISGRWQPGEVVRNNVKMKLSLYLLQTMLSLFFSPLPRTATLNIWKYMSISVKWVLLRNTLFLNVTQICPKRSGLVYSPVESTQLGFHFRLEPTE